MTRANPFVNREGADVVAVLNRDADDVSRWAYELPRPALAPAVNALSAVLADSGEDLILRIKAARALKSLPPHERQPLSSEQWPQALLVRANEAAVLAISQSRDAEFQSACAALLGRILDLAGKAARARLASHVQRPSRRWKLKARSGKTPAR